MTSENDVSMLDARCLRLAARRHLPRHISGSSNTEPISGNVHTYTEALKKYVRREMSRDELELQRKRATDEVSVHWKKLLPQAAN